ncbi:MAG: protoporphyrinogen oxidase [Nitrospirota bacterium]
MRIAVAGAGISGLTIAYAIQEKFSAAGKPAEIFLLEANGRVGGKIRTHRENGYVMEWGPNGFLNNKPDTLELCAKLGIDRYLLLSNDAARKRFIYSGGRLRKLSPGGFVLGGLLTWGGKLRILGEPFIPKKADDSDESLAGFVRRRLGPEALDKLIGPMAQGVYGGDPETMSLKSCFPLIYTLEKEYGGLIKGMFGKMSDKKKEKKTKSGPAGPGGVLTSFEGGLDILTDSLGAAFTGELLLDSPVAKVTPGDGGGFNIYAGGGDTPLKADVFVSAAPAYAASEFISPLDQSAAATLGEIGYAPMAVLGMGFDQKEVGNPLDGFGFLVALSEGKKLIGCLWDSSVFKGRAPSGKASIRCMAGGGRDVVTPSLPDWELTSVTLAELHEMMGLAGQPELVKIFRHEKAIPMYTLGHSERLDRLDAAERKHPGLFFGGNALRGVGLNDCVKDAYAVAEKVMGVV